MRTSSLILAELRHRWLHSILMLLGVIATTTLGTAWFTIGTAAKRETIRLMRDLGYNLRIVPEATDIGDFLERGYSAETMPEDGLQRFAEQKNISYNHILAMLMEHIDLGGSPVILTGITQEIAPKGKKKKSTMLFEVKPGTVHLGYEPSHRLGLKKGATVELFGETFTVAASLSESGSRDDLRIYVNLADAQRLLNKPDLINEIKALECYCKDPTLDNLPSLRQELARFLPEGKLLRREAIATVRKKQRRMADDYFALILPLVMITGALWIGFLALLNVRERRYELGILRALGHDTSQITSLFLGKAAILGVLGGALGFALGTSCALWLGPGVFVETGSKIEPLWSLSLWSLVLAPVFAVAASVIPTVLAITDDPAKSLRGPA